MSLTPKLFRAVALRCDVSSLDEATGRLGYCVMQFNFVVATNERALRPWKSLGFKVVGQLPLAIRAPSFRICRRVRSLSRSRRLAFIGDSVQGLVVEADGARSRRFVARGACALGTGGVGAVTAAASSP